MKRLMIVLAVLLVFSIPAYAQMGGGMPAEQKGEAKQQGMMMDEGMMKSMMGDGMMMQGMMQMMMDMMNVQEKMMMGVKPDEKKQMMKALAQMKEKMQKMMSMGMMGMDNSQAKLKCAEQWLKKAIDLHEIHIKDPKTATEASQMEMMEQMKKAYGCISGTGAETGGTQSKKPAEGEKKKDAHGH